MDKYREVEYSVNVSGPGDWRWTLRRTFRDGTNREIMSAAIFGTEDDAVAAARVAIDKELNENPY